MLARSFIAYQGIHFLFSLAGEGGSRRSRDPCEDEDRTKIQRRDLNMNVNILRYFEQILIQHFANTNLPLEALHKEAGTARQIVT